MSVHLPKLGVVLTETGGALTDSLKVIKKFIKHKFNISVIYDDFECKITEFIFAREFKLTHFFVDKNIAAV